MKRLTNILLTTIKTFLRDTRTHCKFKSAFLPEGWTCVNINMCALDLTKKLEDTMAKKYGGRGRGGRGSCGGKRKYDGKGPRRKK